MRNNENSLKTNSKKEDLEDSDFFENSYYDKEVKIEYPFYANNASESHTSLSKSNSRYTMSIGNPIHAAKTEEIEKTPQKIVKSLSESYRTPSIPLRNNISTSSNLLKGINGIENLS